MPSLAALVLASIALAPAQASGPHLYHMVVGAERKITLQGEPYVPREGDLFLMDDHNRLVQRFFEMVGSGAPLHVTIVFRRPDGRLALLEAGPNCVYKVFLLDLEPRLRDYDGTILVRRLKTPLTEEQSRRLTDFASAQEGKGYALFRLALQGTPCRPRGPLRTALFGKTVLDRDRWTCSEITAAALVAAGLLDGKRYPANSMYPRDFAYDETYDLRTLYDEPGLWRPNNRLPLTDGVIRVSPAQDHGAPVIGQPLPMAEGGIARKVFGLSGQPGFHAHRGR